MEDEENRLALIHAMLHTSPRREERWVDQQQQDGQRERSLWPPTREQVLWTVGIVALLTVVILIGYRYDVTLWDWIKLLIVPAVIAGGGLWFNRQQRDRELESAREQREREVEIAERRTQDEALQAYLDQMSDMLIPKTGQPSLYKARPGDSLSSVARARTRTVLWRLDRSRKGSLVQFLYEAGLIAKNRPIVAMRGANLSGANLIEADLSEADLSGAKGTTNAQLKGQAESLEDATMPNGQKYEDWLKDREPPEG
jgi:hypothetical protein